MIPPSYLFRAFYADQDDQRRQQGVVDVEPRLSRATPSGRRVAWTATGLCLGALLLGGALG